MSAASNNEMKMMEKAAGEFSRDILAPVREETDKYPFAPFFQDVVDKAFKLDFFHVMLPEEVGGIGLGIDALCTILDHICQEDSSLGTILFTTRFAQEILLAAGVHEPLPPMTDASATPREYLVAYPLLMDPAENKLHIKADTKNGKTLLNGSLEYLVLGNLAGQALVPVKTGDNGYTFYFISMDDAGVTQSDPIFSHGLHACPAVDIQLKGVAGSPVGETGKGGDLFTAAREKLQIGVAAMASGLMRGAFKEAMAYCTKRMQGGRKILDWSEMQILLGEMAINVQVSEMLVSKAFQAVKNQENGWKRAATAATLHVTTTATKFVADAIQVMGGVGYMKDFGQEKRFRDAGQIHAFLGLAPLKKIAYLKQFMSKRPV